MSTLRYFTASAVNSTLTNQTVFAWIRRDIKHGGYCYQCKAAISGFVKFQWLS